MRSRFQFSLRVLLTVMLALAVVMAVFAQFPRWSAFVGLMTLLAIIPLAAAGVVRSFVLRIARVGAAGDTERSSLKKKRMLQPMAILRFLGLRHAAENPSGLTGFSIAVLYTLIIVGLWPLLREVGLTIALILAWPLDQVIDYAGSAWLSTFSSGSYWLRLWRWETWAMSRWWLLFGAVAGLWLIVVFPLRAWFKLERVSPTISRVLAFAPWLVLLEMAFLIGVWIESPTTVPEPSTGFVVGIFSWDLWHWDCWLDRGWLIRGALPTCAVGTIFFRDVLRWRWEFAACGGACLIPIALTLSVAWTVLYQDLFHR